MKVYQILAQNGFGNDPTFLGFSHTSLPSKPEHWLAEETTWLAVHDYEKWNGKPKWFTCEICANGNYLTTELVTPMQRPFSCSYGHSNIWITRTPTAIIGRSFRFIHYIMKKQATIAKGVFSLWVVTITGNDGKSSTHGFDDLQAALNFIAAWMTL